MTGGWDQGGWQQDPYQQPQYGPPYDPYGQYQQQDPYAAQGYPGYDPGFGAPPPKKSKLPIVLSLIAIVAIIGGVVAIVLLNRQDDPQPAANVGGSSSTQNKPASTQKLPPATSRRPPSSGAKPPAKSGWTVVEFTGGSYQVPEDWKKTPEKRDSGLGVQFDNGAENGNYDCGGANYFRGFTATSEVQGKDGAELDLEKAVTDFAASFSRKFYNSPEIASPAPTPRVVSGKKAATVTAKLTVHPTKPDCEATSGEVAITSVQIGRASCRERV